MYITFVAFAALASRTLFPCVSISAFNCTASLLSTDSVPPTINKYDDNHRQQFRAYSHQTQWERKLKRSKNKRQTSKKTFALVGVNGPQTWNTTIISKFKKFDLRQTR